MESPTRSFLFFPAYLGLAVWAFWAAGCVSPTQDKVQLFNDDGVTMFGRGDFASARESFAIALELSPHDPDLMYNLGQCYDRLGDFASAERYYAQCLQARAGHAEARYSLGMLYYKMGRHAEYQHLVEEWLRERPKDPEPYVLDGWRLRQEAAYPQAQGRLQQALGLDANNNHALIEMGVLYETLSMPERSLALYERALSQHPNQPEIQQRVLILRSQKIGAPLPLD